MPAFFDTNLPDTAKVTAPKRMLIIQVAPNPFSRRATVIDILHKRGEKNMFSRSRFEGDWTDLIGCLGPLGCLLTIVIAITLAVLHFLFRLDVCNAPIWLAFAGVIVWMKLHDEIGMEKTGADLAMNRAEQIPYWGPELESTRTRRTAQVREMYSVLKPLEWARWFLPLVTSGAIFGGLYMAQTLGWLKTPGLYYSILWSLVIGLLIGDAALFWWYLRVRATSIRLEIHEPGAKLLF